MARRFDLVLFGATGFTGQIIARYLDSRCSQEGLTWAIAGRSVSKLNALQRELNRSHPAIIESDLSDPRQLSEMTSRTRLLLNTVGPFGIYGLPVVAACLETGTHYMDLSGEPAFVNQVFQQYHASAIQAGIAVITSCGFDSIPADYLTWLAVRQLPPESPKSVYVFVRTNAGFSGGTWASAIHGVFHHHQKTRKPAGSKPIKNTPTIPLKIHYNRDMRGWAIPMPVADPHIVKRSARHQVSVYGHAFAYGQFFMRSTWWKMVRTVAPLALLKWTGKYLWVRNALLRRNPPGSGPTVDQRRRSRFEVVCMAKTAEQRIRTRMTGGDPGYDETAKMFSEAAFCLLQLHGAGVVQAGVLTPVEAFGESLVPRLQQAGLHIEW